MKREASTKNKTNHKRLQNYNFEKRKTQTKIEYFLRLKIMSLIPPQ